MTIREKAYLDLARAFADQGNYRKAIENYKKTCRTAEVLETLGEFAYLGRGAEKNLAQAKDYFREAAEQDNVDAICNYALCCEDRKEKLSWYKKAADMGCGYAMNIIGMLLEETPDEEYGEADEWFQQASESGDPAGKFNYFVAMAEDNEENRQTCDELYEAYKDDFNAYAAAIR